MPEPHLPPGQAHQSDVEVIARALCRATGRCAGDGGVPCPADCAAIRGRLRTAETVHQALRASHRLIVS